MDIQNIDEKYETVWEEAKKYYTQVGDAWCPDLKDHIAFNAMGFQHLMRKRGGLRPKEEQIRRFELLPYAKNIIIDPKNVFIPETKPSTHLNKWQKQKNYSTAQAQFWACTVRSNNKKVTVLIGQV